MTTLIWVEIIAFVLLGIYCFGRPVYEFIVNAASYIYCVCYGQWYYARNICFLQCILLTTSCDIKQEKDIESYTLTFAIATEIPKKHMKGILWLFKKMYEANVIVSKENANQPFLPYYDRNLLVEFMNALLTKSELIIEIYNRLFPPLKWLFQNGHEKLVRNYEELKKQHEAISAVPENTMFCMDFEDDKEYTS